MPGFLGGRTGLVQVIDLAGEGGHGVEVCEVQAVDLLLRGGRHRPPTLQHHTHTKVPLLHLPVRSGDIYEIFGEGNNDNIHSISSQVGLHSVLWSVCKDSEGASPIRQGRFVLSHL